MPDLPSPSLNQPYCRVSALEAGLIMLPDEMFITHATPGKVTTAPSLSFLLFNSTNEKKFIFDLGIRKDWHNYPPSIVDWINNVYPVNVTNDVFDSLSKGGTSPADIDYVCLSHCHWDHTGDTVPFTKSEFIVGGDCQKFLVGTYPQDPKGRFATDLLPIGRTRFLNTSEPEWVSIGPFPRALDFFGDGSLYVIDAPGHLSGHINVLARTTSDGAWIYLAGDSAHHWNLITGESDVAVGHPGHVHNCAHEDQALAEDHIKRIQALRKFPRVQVFLAHDSPWFEENKGGSAFWPGTIPPL